MSNWKADADAAYVDEDYATAASLYTKAIAADPSNSLLYSARAQTQLNLEDYLAALESCNLALKQDGRNVKAHFRRGVACWHLEEPETALEAFQEAQKLDPSSSQYFKWVAKCETQLAEEAAQDRDSHAQPLQHAAAQAASPAQQQPAGSGASDSPSTAAPGASDEPPKPAPAQPQPTKYRHQWLQTPKVVEVSIFAKKLTPERVSITISDREFHAVIRDAQGEQEFEMEVQLFGRINSTASKWELLGTKVEVILTKQEVGLNWPTLEASDSRPAANWSLPEPPRSSYPTSSKSNVDWNKLEAELKEEEKKEVLDGDAGVQKLFRDIYGSADEDTRRAMNKSYQESNGTALSTNWGEIRSKSDWKPPENADVKKWEM